MAPSPTLDEHGHPIAASTSGNGAMKEGTISKVEKDDGESATALARQQSPPPPITPAVAVDIVVDNPIVPTPTVPPPAGFLFRRSGAIHPPPIAPVVHRSQDGQHVHWRLSKTPGGKGRGGGGGGVDNGGGRGGGGGGGGDRGRGQGAADQRSVSFSLNDEETPLLGAEVLDKITGE